MNGQSCDCGEDAYFIAETPALFTMGILLGSLTVMALIKSYISINMMHHEDILMQQRKDNELVAPLLSLFLCCDISPTASGRTHYA